MSNFSVSIDRDIYYVVPTTDKICKVIIKNLKMMKLH